MSDDNFAKKYKEKISVFFEKLEEIEMFFGT